MYVAFGLMVLVSTVMAGPWFEMSQSRHIQADVQLNRDVEHIFSDFKRTHGMYHRFNPNPAISIYSQLSLSRIPRDSLKYFEISVPRHIRFAELRKKSFD